MEGGAKPQRSDPSAARSLEAQAGMQGGAGRLRGRQQGRLRRRRALHIAYPPFSGRSQALAGVELGSGAKGSRGAT